MKIDELFQLLESAFSEVPMPPEDCIVCHECEECFSLRDEVCGRTPNELTDTWVEQNFDKLPLFSDDAKRFYFPAFLRFASLNPDSLVTQFTLYSLSDDFRMQPSGSYSMKQSQAILSFLKYVETRVDESDQESVSKARKRWQTLL
jgi:hypothetical protein